jgi:hypothetical protein
MNGCDVVYPLESVLTSAGQRDGRLVEGRQLPQEEQVHVDTQTDRCLMCGLWYDGSALSGNFGDLEYVTTHV